MLRLLIADDEKIIRETLCSIIDWKSLDIEVVGVCKNGLEAYDTILDEYPDIVLTDISMPKLSGLELIQKITQNHDNIQFIIISGYQDFSYAREAMKYGIKHYILKPCNEQEIIEAVKDSIKEHYRKSSRKDSELKFPFSGGDMKKNLMYDILMQLLSSDLPTEKLPSLYETHLDFYHTPYHLCYIFFLEETFISACLTLMQRFFDKHHISFSFAYIYVKNSLLFFFTDPPEGFSISSELANFFAEHMPESPCTFLEETYASLLPLLETVCRKVKRYETIYLYSGTHPITICNYNYVFQKTLEISDQLAKETDEKLHQNLLEELKQLLISVKNLEFLRSLVNSLLLKTMQNSSASPTVELANFMMFTASVSSNQEICDFLFEKLEMLYPTPVISSGKLKPFIQEILDYTNEHIGDCNLTLKWIVENQLFMNVDYVSRQFVLQTGIKFSAYLNELRIKKAKQLLINCDAEKIYSIAEQVGCGNNPQYFSHLFKKYTKMTPKEYITKMKMEDHNSL